MRQRVITAPAGLALAALIAAAAAAPGGKPRNGAGTDPAAAVSPWPMFCHDPARTCRSPFTGPAARPAGPRWMLGAPGGFTSSVAVGAGGTVYAGTALNDAFYRDKTAGYSGYLAAAGPDGKVLWKHDSGRGSPMISMIESCPLLTADGKVVYGKDDGHVYALDAASGRLLWDFRAGDAWDGDKHDDNEQFIPSPVQGPDGTIYALSHWGNVYGRRVIDAWKRNPLLRRVLERYAITSSTAPVWGKLYALDPRTGAAKWVFDPSAQGGEITFWGSPSIGGDGTLYAAAYDGSSRGYLYALDGNGALKWTYPGEKQGSLPPLQSAPAVGSDGTIYAGAYGAKAPAALYAFRPDGTLKWSFPVAENRITSGPGIGPDGTLYFGSHNHPAGVAGRKAEGRLYAVADLGPRARLKWKYRVDYGIVSSPAIDAAGNVFFSNASIQPFPRGKLGAYHLYALDSRGKKLWSYPFSGCGWGAPAIGEDGTVYLGVMGEKGGGLYAFGGQRRE